MVNRVGECLFDARPQQRPDQKCYSRQYKSEHPDEVVSNRRKWPSGRRSRDYYRIIRQKYHRILRCAVI